MTISSSRLTTQNPSTQRKDRDRKTKARSGQGLVTVDNLTDEYDGLSTDTKPTDGVRNGSVFAEMDTGKVYLFDAENDQWVEQ